MKSGSSIEILRAGRFVARNGKPVEFSEADVAAIAASYDPALHEAPLVYGHPKHDDPAMGWVQSLKADQGSLEATPCRVQAELSEAVAKGRYGKVSASLYPPGSASNPVPEGWYLRHVGFLGAQPPAVKGLRPVQLAEDDDAVEIEFGEREIAWGFTSIADLFRKLREWIIEDKDIDTADKMLPDWAITSVERAAASAEVDAGTQFAEPAGGSGSGGNAVSDQSVQLSEKEQELADRETRLAQREAEAADREATAKRQGAVEFAEAQVQAGRILPRQKDGLVETLVALEGTEPVEFAEGDDAAKDHELAPWLRGLVEGLEPQVDLTEHAPAPGGEPAPRREAPAPGADPERQALHRKALDLSERENIEYVEAVKRLER